MKEGSEINMKLRYKKGRPITSLITKVIIKLLFKIIGLPQWLRGKESTCNAGDTGDDGSILGWGGSLEEGMASHSSILVWRISRTEEPGGLQSRGQKELDELSRPK